MNNSLDVTDFQIETIKSNIEQLYKEKFKLQQKLKELRNYRHQVEDTLDKVTSKLNQINERHFKMMETKGVAALKAETMEKAAKGMETNNIEMRKNIQETEQLLEEEKKQQMETIVNFENRCQQLVELFINAQVFYEVGNLDEQKHKLEVELKMLRELKTEKEAVLQSKEAVLGKIRNSNFEENLENFEEVLKIFKDENKLCHNTLSDFEEKEAALKNMLNERN